MMRLTRKQASTIFKARTRMTKVKGNYKNGYNDLKCRACKSVEESHQHVLKDCTAIHKGKNLTIEPFSEDLNQLKETANNIEDIMIELEK